MAWKYYVLDYGITWDYNLYITTTKEDNMNVEEITLIMNTTKTLRDMCSSNHAHTKALNIELQKLVKVIIGINNDLQKVEQRLNRLEGKQ
jgi:predicted  nucleic acid-binding Zn-ribbon protein